MKIKPLFNNVVLKQISQPKPKQSAIILPNTNDDSITLMGEVIAVGGGNKNYDMQLTVGNKVIYNNYSASSFTLDEVEYVLISQTDVLAVVS